MSRVTVESPANPDMYGPLNITLPERTLFLSLYDNNFEVGEERRPNAFAVYAFTLY